ncbi:MAG: T9SS type A sorting domain-containing protein [Bacteroidia bacterium]
MKKSLLIVSFLIAYVAFNSFSQVNYQWVKSIGGGNGESGLAITTTNDGQYVYVTGKMGSSNIDFNIYGTTPIVLNGSGTSCFIAKYDTQGNCIWAKNMLGQGNLALSIGFSIVTDGSDNIYIGGIFNGEVDFDPGSNTVSLVSNNVDAFVAKYNNNGDFQWVRSITGANEEIVKDIAIDDLNGGVYVSGFFGSDTITFSNTTDTLFNKGGKDAFVAGYDLNGGTLLWKNSIGSTGNDLVSDIDANDSYVVVTGVFEDTLFFNYNADTLLPSSTTNTFFGKYDLGGNYGWMEKIGGTNATCVSTGIAIENNNIHVTGVYSGTIQIDPNSTSATLTALGSKDVFFAKYDLGTTHLWSGRIGSETSNSNNTATVAKIAVDAMENIYISGAIIGTVDFDPSSNNLLETSSGLADIYFCKYDNNGQIQWVKTIGEGLNDTLSFIAVDNNNNIYLTGEYKNSFNFNPNGVANRISVGFEDMFIAKYSQGVSKIIGAATYGNASSPVNIGTNKVKLFTQIPNDGNQAMALVEESVINSAGLYEFSELPSGTYYVLATANTSDYEDVAPTYYGNTIDWQFATPLVLTNDTVTADINMIQYTTPNGSATLSGYVYEGGGFDRVQGDPIPNRDIVLEGDPNSIIIAHTETNDSGRYEFVNIPAGCYKIYVNIPGLPMDSTHHECPTITDSIINLDFIADSSSIGIIPNTTGIKDNTLNKTTHISIYPNPHNGVMFAQLELAKESTIKVELFNIIGKKMLDLGKQTAKAGKTKIEISTQQHNIGAGIYFLKIIVNNTEIFTEKVVQTN